MGEEDAIIELNQYMYEAFAFDTYPKNEFSVGYLGLGLTGEAGEVADKIKKVFRDCHGDFSEKNREEIAKELGDVLWYTAMLAYKLGYSLEDIANINIQKLKDRRERNVINGNGDNR